jgi:hypothetical protein
MARVMARNRSAPCGWRSPGQPRHPHGWCCSVREWGMTARRLDSTVAALAFNRVAQETYEKHDCTHSTQTQNLL